MTSFEALDAAIPEARPTSGHFGYGELWMSLFTSQFQPCFYHLQLKQSCSPMTLRVGSGKAGSPNKAKVVFPLIIVTEH